MTERPIRIRFSTTAFPSIQARDRQAMRPAPSLLGLRAALEPRRRYPGSRPRRVPHENPSRAAPSPFPNASRRLHHATLDDTPLYDARATRYVISNDRMGPRRSGSSGHREPDRRQALTSDDNARITWQSGHRPQDTLPATGSSRVRCTGARPRKRHPTSGRGRPTSPRANFVCADFRHAGSIVFSIEHLTELTVTLLTSGRQQRVTDRHRW
jgi:hypothetical protein